MCRITGICGILEFFSETVLERSEYVEFLEYLEFSQVWIITLGGITGICGILEFFLSLSISKYFGIVGICGITGICGIFCLKIFQNKPGLPN